MLSCRHRVCCLPDHALPRPRLLLQERVEQAAKIAHDHSAKVVAGIAGGVEQHAGKLGLAGEDVSKALDSAAKSTLASLFGQPPASQQQEGSQAAEPAAGASQPAADAGAGEPGSQQPAAAAEEQAAATASQPADTQPAAAE